MDFIIDLNWIRNHYASRAKGRFGFTSILGLECHTRVWGLRRRCLGVSLEHQNCLAYPIANVLPIFMLWRQTKCLAIKSLSSLRVDYRNCDDLNATKTERGCVHINKRTTNSRALTTAVFVATLQGN